MDYCRNCSTFTIDEYGRCHSCGHIPHSNKSIDEQVRKFVGIFVLIFVLAIGSGILWSLYEVTLFKG